MSNSTLSSVYVSRSRRRNGTLPTQGAILKPKGLNDVKNPQLAEVAAALTNLAPFAKKLKNQLPAGATQDLKTVTRTIAILRGTEHYDQLKALVVEAFKERPYEIGTVGAYFVNCAEPAVRDTCALPCVGNLVLNDGVEDVCPLRIFALKHEGRASRVLLALNEAADVPGTPSPEALPRSDGAQAGRRAIVYIYLDPSKNLGGLTAAELESLMNLGIREVSMLYYDPATYEQTAITPGFVPVNSISPVQSYRSADNSSGWLAVLAIIVVVVLVFLVWALYKRRKN